MKILFLGFGKIAYMPYMNFYLEELGREKIELIYWDRDGKKDAEIPQYISKAYKYENYLEEQYPFRRKIKYFWGYRKFALKILKENKYDKIIVLHTTPGLTLLDYLIRKYKKRYVLDFRDISYEYKKFYKYLVGLLAQNAGLTFVSSDSFRKFLPKFLRIYTIHNFSKDIVEFGNKNEVANKEIEKDKIKVAYWGLVRHVDVNKKIIDELGNDDRFELHYYGRMQQDGRNMEQYVHDKGYVNIFFHGSYLPKERFDFMKDTDLVHNIYDTGFTMGNAMGNKYYDGIFMKIPQICTKGSYMGEVIARENVGLVLDLTQDNLADVLWKYFQKLDREEFSKACVLSQKKVLEEQKNAKAKLLEFIYGSEWTKE